jgi:hypothetical protein
MIHVVITYAFKSNQRSRMTIIPFHLELEKKPNSSSKVPTILAKNEQLGASVWQNRYFGEKDGQVIPS